MAWANKKEVKKWLTKKWLIIALISDLLIREVVTMIFMIGEKVSDRNQVFELSQPKALRIDQLSPLTVIKI